MLHIVALTEELLAILLEQSADNKCYWCFFIWKCLISFSVLKDIFIHSWDVPAILVLKRMLQHFFLASKVSDTVQLLKLFFLEVMYNFFPAAFKVFGLCFHFKMFDFVGSLGMDFLVFILWSSLNLKPAHL